MINLTVLIGLEKVKMKETELKFIPVNESNIAEVARLHISSLQKGMVETVEECFSEAQQLSLWRPVAISKGNELIGFAMYGLWKNEGENGRVWLDRFLIDECQQGKGYANLVLPNILKHIADEYQCEKIYLSVYDNNTVAIHLYEKFGFLRNGETDINGEKVMMCTVLRHHSPS